MGGLDDGVIFRRTDTQTAEGALMLVDAYDSSPETSLADRYFPRGRILVRAAFSLFDEPFGIALRSGIRSAMLLYNVPCSRTEILPDKYFSNLTSRAFFREKRVEISCE